MFLKRFRAVCLSLFVFVTWSWCGPALAEGPSHLAIVIGNQRYAALDDLPNVRPDSAAMERIFRTRGYRTVRLDDFNRASLLSALARLRLVAQNASQVVVYFAGHGLEIDGRMFLLMPDVDPGNSNWQSEAIPVDFLVRVFSDQPRQKIILIDACRDNPMYSRTSATKGQPQPLTAGTLLAYAAQPGAAAMDGVGGHSPFAAAVLSAMLVGESDVLDILRMVRVAVVTETSGRQVPWIRSSLMRQARFLIEPLH